MLIDDPAVLHVGGQKTQGNRGDLMPTDLGAARKGGAGRAEKAVKLSIKRGLGDASQGFVVEIGDACIKL